MIDFILEHKRIKRIPLLIIILSSILIDNKDCLGSIAHLLKKDSLYQEAKTERTIVPISPIHNPERGFYLEDMFYAHNLKNPFHPNFSYTPTWIKAINKRDKTENQKASLIQLYIYLTPYVGKLIPDSAFNKMQRLFDEGQQEGYKFILRFAYDTNFGETNANFEDVYRHLKQLRPFILKNIGLIYVMQMGFIGAWGEGNGSPMSEDWTGKSILFKKELDMLRGRQVTSRYPNRKDSLNLPESYMKRIGYNNDYFTASKHKMAPGNDYVVGSNAYKQVRKESPYLQVVGEMPYPEKSKWGLHDLINIWEVLTAFRDHHYTSFSASHNIKPNIAHWKEFPLSIGMLNKHHILFDSSYFVNKDGEYCFRSAYDFIRDHLGYRLVLDTSLTKLNIQNEVLNYNIQFRNVGFSAIHNPRPVYLVFIDNAGHIVQSSKLNTAPSAWQPYNPNINDYKALIHKIEGKLSLNLSSGEYRVGLWMPDPTNLLKYDPKYAIQFANRSMEKWMDKNNQYKVNIIGKVSL